MKIYDRLLKPEKLNSNEIDILFSMLRLKPDSSQKCADLNFVRNYIPQDYHEHVGDVLVYFMKLCLPTNNLKSVDWVYVVPLIHIFKKKINPFDTPTRISQKIKWTDGNIDLTLLRKPATNAVPG